MIAMQSLPSWEDGEETANMWTHLVGIVLSVAAAVLVILQDIRSHDAFKLAGNIVYAISMITMYTISTLYHGSKDLHRKTILRYGDHCSIYLLIAGSYTPYALTVLRKTVGWYIFGWIWTIAAIGITLKIMFFDKFEKLSLLFFLLMGWTMVFAIKQVFETCSHVSIYWLVIGGIFYTIGTFFYSRDEVVPFFHAIWHVFVVLGSVGIFMCIYTME